MDSFSLLFRLLFEFTTYTLSTQIIGYRNGVESGRKPADGYGADSSRHGRHGLLADSSARKCILDRYSRMRHIAREVHVQYTVVHCGGDGDLESFGVNPIVDAFVKTICCSSLGVVLSVSGIIKEQNGKMLASIRLFTK